MINKCGNKYNNISKSLTIVLALIMFLFLFGLSNVNADTKKTDEVNSLFDTQTMTNVYKFSDDKTVPTIPYVRVSNNRIVMDKDFKRLGFTFSLSSIDVTEELTEQQIIASNDTVRISSTMKSAMIFSTGNVIIDGNITENLIIVSGSNVEISEKATINKDVIIFANNINVKGNIKGSLISRINNNAQISGIIDGDLRINTDTLTVSGNDNIKGNVYVETYNEDLVIKDKYPNATVKIFEKVDNSIFSLSSILKTLTIALVFTLVYLIVQKISKNKGFSIMLEKVKNNPFFTIIMGAILLIASPLIILLLGLLSIYGVEMIALPLLLIYGIGLLVIAMLSAFIAGGVMFNYISKKYFKEIGFAGNILGTFCVYLSLQLLTMIPVVGGYISAALVLMSVGMIVTCIFKKNK